MAFKETIIKRWDKQLIKEKTSIINAEKYSLEKVLAKNSELISKFLEITERKVSTIDEYGDENWDALEEQVEIVFKKIAKNLHINPNVLFIKPEKKVSKKVLEKAALGKNEIIYRTFKKLHGELRRLFKEYHKKKKNGRNKNVEIATLSGVDFETYIANILKENGYQNVSGTPKTGDQGADLIAKKNGKKIIIQAKRYQGSVGNGAVQEVIAALKFYEGDEGWVVTNSTFTPSARALAHKSGVKLVDGHQLQDIR